MSPRKLVENKLVIASHNQGKLDEMAALLKPFHIEAKGAKELGLIEPEETGDSFRANAILKAQSAACAAKQPALADDSGLVVDALNGAPGIYSARWALRDDGKRDFNFAMSRVEQALADIKDEPRTARFICALCLAWPDGYEVCFEGRVEGALVFPPRGTRGFGYDPIFVKHGEDLTFGEMEPALKHNMSHRADAFRQLSQACLMA